jgi:hypothetical protein
LEVSKHFFNLKGKKIISSFVLFGTANVFLMQIRMLKKI